MSTKEAVRRLLREKGPLIGENLAAALVAAGSSRSAPAARKAVERAGVHSTEPVRFPHAFLYYLDEHHPRAYQKAVQALLPARPGYHRVFKLLLANGGWATLGQIAKAGTCVPDGDATQPGGRETVSETLSRLCKIEVIEPDPRIRGVFRFHPTFGKRRIPLERFLAGLVREQLLFDLLREWLRENAMLSWTRHSVRESEFDAVPFNSTLWDFAGPTYLGPHSRRGAADADSVSATAFVVGDVVAARPYRQSDVDGLHARLLAVLRRRRKSESGAIAYFPVSFALSYSVPAFDALKRLGVLPLTVRSVLGRDADEVLMRFAEIQALSLQGKAVDLAAVEEVLDRSQHLHVLEGFIDNMQGELFATLVALAWSQQGYAVERERPLRGAEGKPMLPVDVVATRGRVVTLIECKGRATADTRDTVENLESLFKERCERAATTWKQDDRPVPSKAIYITTGKLDDAAAAYALATKRSHGIGCEVWTMKELLAFVRQVDEKHLPKILTQYYGRKSRPSVRTAAPASADDVPF